MSRSHILWAGVGAVLLGFLLARMQHPRITGGTPPRVDSTTKKPDASGLPKGGWLASVGDETIGADEIEWEVKLHTTVPKISDGDASKPSSDASSKPNIAESSLGENSDSLNQRLLVTIIERKLLYKWIKEYSEGFDHDNPSRYLSCLSELKELAAAVPDFFSQPSSKERLKARLCEQSLIDQYLYGKIYPLARVTDDEIAAYYNDHLDEFREPQKVIFRQILLPTEKSALELRPTVNRGNFAALAKEHSIAPEADQGGKVGPFSREQLPTFFDLVFNMQLGEISGIVRSDYGFHIIMPLERIPATTRSLGEARKGIYKKIEATRRQEQYQNWLTTAMNAIPVRSNVGDKNP